MTISIRPATIEDADTILMLIKGLADYEKLSHEVVATKEKIVETLFGKKKYAECLLAEKQIEQSEQAEEVDQEKSDSKRDQTKTVGFALFFHNYSTFLGQPGMYLEDLFVLPKFRGEGVGKTLLKTVAKIAVERNCGRVEWSVLDWNQPAIDFYDSLEAIPMQQWITYRLTGNALQNIALK